MKKTLTQFLRQHQGVALIEFAMVFPVFFVLLFGGIEVNRLMLIQQKHEKAGYVLPDIITRYTPATATGATGEISGLELARNVFPQMTRIMAPYDRADRQAVILTSIRKTSENEKTIEWQIAGGGTLSGCDDYAPPHCVISIVNDSSPSAIATSARGTPARLPSAQSALLDAYMPGTDDANIIVAEVFYFYQPLLQRLLRDVGAAGGDGIVGFRFFLRPRIYIKRTYFVPRNGALYDLPPDFPVR